MHQVWYAIEIKKQNLESNIKFQCYCCAKDFKYTRDFYTRIECLDYTT